MQFANSTEDQVDRIARLGALVSSTRTIRGFADKYSQNGLGPERVDAMTRNNSALRAGIPLSFHSDLPMAPADPLALLSYAVNRRTQSGRVAGPEQRVSVEAAYSWRREHDIDSIAPGKIANFTVVGRDPLEVDPAILTDIQVVGTVFERRWFPIADDARAKPVARSLNEAVA